MIQENMSRLDKSWHPKYRLQIKIKIISAVTLWEDGLFFFCQTSKEFLLIKVFDNGPITSSLHDVCFARRSKHRVPVILLFWITLHNNPLLSHAIISYSRQLPQKSEVHAVFNCGGWSIRVKLLWNLTQLEQKIDERMEDRFVVSLVVSLSLVVMCTAGRSLTWLIYFAGLCNKLLNGPCLWPSRSEISLIL